ncbi:MAG: signal peptidase I [Chloroflexota bacterium]
MRKIGRGLSQIILLGVMVSVIGCSLLEQRFKVEGSAMEPTLKPGTTVTAHKADQYKRGDIIVFEYPLDRQRIFLKRIVGLPGETLEIKDGKVFINGQPLNEPYVLEPAKSTTLATTVPPDNFYVLGDNRNHSNDSRDWGTVEREYIRGVVRE